MSIHPVIPFLASCKEAVDNYLPDSSEKISTVFESSTLWEVVKTNIQNLPWIAFGSEFAINDLFHFAGVRFSYVKIIFVSVADIGYSTMGAVFFISLRIITLNLSSYVNSSSNKHINHTIYAFVGIGIGVAGTLIPSLGILISYEFGKHLARQIFEQDLARDRLQFEEELIIRIKAIYKQHGEQVYEFADAFAAQNGVPAERRTMHIVNPLRRFTKQLPNVRNLDGLVELIYSTVEKIRTGFQFIPPSPAPNHTGRGLARSDSDSP